MDETLRQERIDLAAALRLAVRFELNEGIDNHFSYAPPGGDGRFLVSPYGLHWSEVTASDILMLDQQGNVLEGDPAMYETSAFTIHSQIHRLHPRAACVLHSHMPYATALTAIEGGRLEPVHQNSLRFYGDVAYDEDYNGIASDVEEGARIAGTLGDKRILFMANHGIVVVGATISGAFDDLYYLERACQVQLIAMQSGRPLKILGDNQARPVAAAFQEVAERRAPHIHFAALKRLLDRDEPGYAG